MGKPKMYGYFKPYTPNNQTRLRIGFGKRKGKKK